MLEELMLEKGLVKSLVVEWEGWWVRKLSLGLGFQLVMEMGELLATSSAAKIVSVMEMGGLLATSSASKIVSVTSLETYWVREWAKNIHLTL
jgi:hypothetical protein